MLYYRGEDHTDGCGYPAPIAARREPPQPGPYRSLPEIPERKGLEWHYLPCAGARDLGRYIFVESHAGALDSTTWAFPVAAAMGWQVDTPSTGSDSAWFQYGTFTSDSRISTTNISISMDQFSFSIVNGKRPRVYAIDMERAVDEQRLYVTGRTAFEQYFQRSQRYSFQHYLPERMNIFISQIQTIIDESLREVNLW